MDKDGWDDNLNWQKIDFLYKNDLKNYKKINFENLENIDGIFVLAGGINSKGMCHPWVIERLNLAYEIYDKTKKDIFCLGGGSYHIPPILNKKKFAIHESTSCSEYLISLGVNSKNIFKEWSSYDTIANAFFSFLNFIIPLEFKDIVLITSDFHITRTKVIFDWIKSIFKVNINIIYLSVSDETFDQNIISKRIKREKNSTINLIKNVINKVNNKEKLFKWFYTEHKAYCSNSELLRNDEITEDEKKSY